MSRWVTRNEDGSFNIHSEQETRDHWETQAEISKRATITLIMYFSLLYSILLVMGKIVAFPQDYSAWIVSYCQFVMGIPRKLLSIVGWEKYTEAVVIFALPFIMGYIKIFRWFVGIVYLLPSLILFIYMWVV